MAALIDLRALVIGHVPECPDFLIETETLSAARAFCKDTWIWQDGADEDEELTVDPLEEQLVYDLTCETGEHVIGVSSVLKNDSAMDPGTEYAKGIRTAQIVFTTAFSSTDEVLVKRVYRPSASATEIPDFLVEEYGEILANKVIASLLKMSRKPWTDPEKAMHHENLYKAGVQDTIGAAMKGNTNQSLSAYPRDF